MITYVVTLDDGQVDTIEADEHGIEDDHWVFTRIALTASALEEVTVAVYRSERVAAIMRADDEQPPVE